MLELFIFRDGRRKFTSRVSDSMDKWGSRSGESQRRERKKKEDPGARKSRKVANHWTTLYFSMLCGSGDIWSAERSKLIKIACRCGKVNMHQNLALRPLFEVEVSTKCTPLWSDAHLEIRKIETLHCRSTLGRWNVQKVHEDVGRSLFGSQKVKLYPGKRPPTVRS